MINLIFKVYHQWNYSFFQPKSDKNTITRDVLVAGCEECFLAHSGFADLTYKLIIEKLLDDETEEIGKIEICLFLVNFLLISQNYYNALTFLL